MGVAVERKLVTGREGGRVDEGDVESGRNGRSKSSCDGKGERDSNKKKRSRGSGEMGGALKLPKK